MVVRRLMSLLLVFLQPSLATTPSLPPSPPATPPPLLPPPLPPYPPVPPISPIVDPEPHVLTVVTASLFGLSIFVCSVSVMTVIARRSPRPPPQARGGFARLGAPVSASQRRRGTSGVGRTNLVGVGNV